MPGQYSWFAACTTALLVTPLAAQPPGGSFDEYGDGLLRQHYERHAGNAWHGHRYGPLVAVER